MATGPLSCNDPLMKAHPHRRTRISSFDGMIGQAVRDGGSTRRQFVCRSAMLAFLSSCCPLNGAALARQSDLPFQEIEDGIHVRYGLQEVITAGNHGAIANIGFIIGDESVAVVDTGTTYAQGVLLMAAVRHVTDKPVSHVIATHVHLDHCFGHGAFEDAAPVFVGHHRLPGALSERGDFYLEQIKTLSLNGGDTKVVQPNFLVDDAAEIDLGGRKLLLKAWPAAHTDNDLTVFDTRTGLLWAGDLLFVDRIPIVDGSLNGWIDHLDELMSGDVSQVMPGHGALGSGREAIEQQKEYLVSLRDGVRAAIADGLDMTEAVAQLADLAGPNWLLRDEGHGRNIIAAYAELEWE
ncbi:quinoprotein relay system zinc metallohydrolase 2 [Georhizobium profundi]|uniref:Quinoprotein relay system zinc metallohydrolase 2 n=2 Tax=Georhizobium profundi TaxID=2341112 RepID=A0A3S9B0T3_9HYPH|nr:quinoprotein relay system zinc metallohydrolase 2 [Georhizobium profundi]